MRRKIAPPDERPIVLVVEKRKSFISQEKALEHREGGARYDGRLRVHLNGSNYYFVGKDGKCKACAQGGCYTFKLSILRGIPRRQGVTRSSKPNKPRDFYIFIDLFSSDFLDFIEGDLKKIFSGLPPDEIKRATEGIRMSLAGPLVPFYSLSGLTPTASETREELLGQCRSEAREHKHAVYHHLQHLYSREPWRSKPKALHHLMEGVSKYWDRVLVKAAAVALRPPSKIPVRASALIRRRRKRRNS